jgi:hypothetical protein
VKDVLVLGPDQHDPLAECQSDAELEVPTTPALSARRDRLGKADEKISLAQVT